MHVTGMMGTIGVRMGITWMMKDITGLSGMMGKTCLVIGMTGIVRMAIWSPALGFWGKIQPPPGLG